MFCKRRCVIKKAAGVSEQPFIDPLQNRCSWIKFTGKNLLESLFNKSQLWEPATLLKKAPTQVFFCEICKLFKNNYFKEHLWTSASKLYLKRDFNTVVFLWILGISQEHLFVEDPWTVGSKTPVRGRYLIKLRALQPEGI